MARSGLLANKLSFSLQSLILEGEPCTSPLSPPNRSLSSTTAMRRLRTTMSDAAQEDAKESKPLKFTLMIMTALLLVLPRIGCASAADLCSLRHTPLTFQRSSQDAYEWLGGAHATNCEPRKWLKLDCPRSMEHDSQWCVRLDLFV